VSDGTTPDSDDTSIRWIFRLDSTLPEHGVNANFFDRSLAASVGETVDCFSYHEKPGYMIVGFLADGNGEKSDIGFAVFEFENRRYKLLDYHVYADAAVIKVHAPTDSKAYNGICFAADPAVCNASGESDGGAAYDVILSNNERLSSITRVVDGKQEATSKIDNNPSMTLFLRSNVVDGQDISYQFAYDELSNNEISGLFSYSVSDIEKIEFQDGNTGRLTPYTSETEIKDIVEHLNAFQYDQIEPVASDGWTYAVRLWFKDGSDMQRITLRPSSASVDGNHYISSEHEYFPQEWLEQYRTTAALFGFQFDTESTEIKAVVRKGTDNEDEWVRSDILAESAKKCSARFLKCFANNRRGGFYKKSLNIPDYSIEIYTSAGEIKLNLYGKTSDSGFAATRINDEWQRYSVSAAEYDELMELLGFKKTGQ
jgi:hypothetical protein